MDYATAGQTMSFDIVKFIKLASSGQVGIFTVVIKKSNVITD